MGAYDALGICNGSCEEDQDGDGVCDSEEVLGCDDESAINYDSSATENDGNCNYLSEAPAGFDFTPTPSSATMYGYVTIDALNATGLDWIGAFTPEGICAGATSLYMFEGLAYINMTIYGDDATTLDVQEGVGFNGSFLLKLYDASTSVVLNLDDGMVLTGWYNTNGGPLPGYNDPQTEYAFFYPSCADESACNFDANSLTNDGCEYPLTYYDCAGECVTDIDADGICDEIDECIGEFDDCGVCNGPGAIYDCGCFDIPDDQCDCQGNVYDALFTCGGDCEADLDNDNVCDDVDECVGEYDACGICNGPGAIYECGCSDIPDGACDCDGNGLDAIGVCGGECLSDVNGNMICDSLEESGCTNPLACNYNPQATLDDGDCEYISCYGCLPSGGLEPGEFVPSPEFGESFDDASYGEEYLDALQFALPVFAADLDGLDMAPQGVLLDSLEVVNIAVVNMNDTTQVTDLGYLGLDYTCNNLGNSPNACTFLGGSQRCISISGSPQVSGAFKLVFDAKGYYTLNGVAIWNDLEWVAIRLNVTLPELCLGDFNLDGLVQLNDLLDLLSAYGQPCDGCLPDMNGDGLVQLNDLLDLLSAYGNVCDL